MLRENEELNNKLKKCEICPHKCKINRLYGNKGRCKCDNKVKVALASIHKYEEPCISGTKGSGTVFFSNCNLHCVYCQNYKISQLGKGEEVSIEQLAYIFLSQQSKGAHNINLVTPTMYVIQIVQAIKIAKEKGLRIPIIYNSNAYENIETIQMLQGYIDVFLPDIKYYSNDMAEKYSEANNYFQIATNAVKEMYKLVGKTRFNNNGIMERGLMIRHLVIPSYMQNSKNILKWIKENMPDDIYVSVMAQYFPTYKAKQMDLINRKLKIREYKEIQKYIYTLGMKNVYIQDLEKDEMKYVPNF